MRRPCYAWIALLSLIVAVGCASTRRGSVVMRIDERTAHVCLGDDEVAVGDTVTLYRQDCTGEGGLADDGTTAVLDDPHCVRSAIGEGEVVRTLNEHYSVIRVEPGVAFREGTLVEAR